MTSFKFMGTWGESKSIVWFKRPMGKRNTVGMGREKKKKKGADVAVGDWGLKKGPHLFPIAYRDLSGR